MEKKNKMELIQVLTMALGVGLLPPIWAVLSPHFGVTTGAVALICAGLFVASGNRRKDALKISLGFLLGDLWAVIAMQMMELMNFNSDAELFITLFVLGVLAVIIGLSQLKRLIYLPAWLCGWAIGLTIMSPVGLSKIGSLPIQIGVSMLVGIWYVGVGVDIFQQWMVKIILKIEIVDKTKL
jgi:hypothetical protein